MPFTNVTVTGNFHDPNGKALNGTIEAVLSGVMQNGVCTTSPKVIKAKIINGTTSFTLKANDDPGTLPENRLYTFKITIAGGPQETFKVRVPHEPGSVDIAELRRESGIVGAQPEGRPVLNQHSSNQAIVEALAFLELITEDPLAFASGARGPQLTGPQGEPGPPGPPGPPSGLKIRAIQTGKAEGTASATASAFVEPSLAKAMLLGIWASCVIYLKPIGEATHTGYKLQLILNTGEGKYTAAEVSGSELGTTPTLRTLNGTVGWGFPENGQDAGHPIYELVAQGIALEGEVRLVNTEPANGSIVIEKSVVDVREL